MTYSSNPNFFQSFELANSEAELLLMRQAAQAVPGVTVEPLAKTTARDIDEAAKQYGALALEANRLSVFFGLADRAAAIPADWAETARKVQRAGGFVVRLTADASSGEDGESDTSAYFDRLNALREEQPEVS